MHTENLHANMQFPNKYNKTYGNLKQIMNYLARTRETTRKSTTQTFYIIWDIMELNFNNYHGPKGHSLKLAVMFDFHKSFGFDFEWLI